LKPVQIFSEFDFVLPDDQKLKKEEQTVFVLQSLTVEQEAFLDDTIEGEVPGQMKYGSTILNVLHMGLKGVKNFPPGGKQIKFARDETAEKLPGDVHPWKSSCLQRIDVQSRRLISAKIRSLSQITEEESKNS